MAVTAPRRPARPAATSAGGGIFARFLLRRLLLLAVTLAVASVAVFGLIAVLPGSPAQVILGTAATPASVRQLTAQLGLNQPVWQQYLHWAGGLLSGRLGDSYISQQPVGPEIWQALTVTGPLVLLGLAVGLAVGLTLGVLAARHHRGLAGAAFSAASQLGIAVPSYVAGILLLTIVTVKLHWLPDSAFNGWSAGAGPALESLVLPCVALGLAEGAVVSRYVRSSVVEVLRSDYLRTARAKGLRPGQALVRHGLRNAAVPVVTVLGLEIAGLLVGAIIVENVFTLPGLGTMLVQAIDNRDLILVQDIVMLIVAAVLVVNLLVDVSYRLLDPRIALGS
ncbi:MAG TPA: ABC transporter permease [Trebonia sp.]|nr:ABC transporter permease [Trebonia sp.]